MSTKGTLNQVTLVGNIGQTPEHRTTATGMSIANISVATTESRKSDGGYVDHTDWHRVVAFGSAAKYLSDYGRKGSKVLINGRLQTRKWQDTDGRDHYATEVIADRLQLLDRPAVGANEQQPAAPTEINQSETFDDDIPF